ncbi:uncharacterized protein J8A68_004700 [[Candida] subhashii]|uniref:Phosducin domain-containing protein n=1 Tax=[Candida] subhashii TaxID=561895 RepID=A0A8J5QF15_9ASCO|nr:uncharacterized protein J8A68_004700 [[Candida] subhashii]KAG7661752.1 hypothetical protein J8A68_004700 [[Candida] subhashii]
MNEQDSRLVEQYQQSKLNNKSPDSDDNHSEDEDDLLAELEEDDSIIQKYRESRIEQLSKQFKQINETIKTNDNNELGEIIFIESEKNLMNLIIKQKYSIISFYQPNFSKCQLMNSKLKLLCENHLNLKVFAIKAENAPFLVEKLNIRILPCVIIYKDGKELDRLIGFEKLGNDPNSFSYDSLETYLYRWNVITRKSINRVIRSKANNNNDDSDESDLDL